MKKFISTKLFLTLQEASQKGVNVDAQVLENGYNDFACLLFTETSAAKDKAAFYQTLCYTQVELEDLYSQQASVLKKKCTGTTVFKESDCPCQCANGIRQVGDTG
jgi:hypothetical protein